MPSLNDFLFILMAYIIGSFPSGLIIGKVFYNIDIRNHGSGNLGGSNALRVLGKKGGLAVYLLDILKGGIVVLIAMHFYEVGTHEIHPLIVAIFSLVGHIFPIFAGFRGGKAVATSAGIILFYVPMLFLLLAVVFFGSLALWKMISVSSVLSSIVTFIVAWINPLGNHHFEGLTPRIIFTLFMILIVVKHIPNYKRIIAGTEAKIGQKKST